MSERNARLNVDFFPSFDLRSLSNTTYKVVSGNHSYVFGVCDAPKESCLAGTGACETSNGQSSSLGIASHELMLASDGTGSPYLVYESGSVCGTLNAKWNTTIEFICLTAGMSAEPTVVENTDCRLIIHFPTKLACRTTVSSLSGTLRFLGSFEFRFAAD